MSKLRDSFIAIHRNLSQLKKLPSCKIVNVRRYGFSAELYIREGRYLIRIDYSEKEEPRVFMVSPKIDMSSSAEIHTYGMKYHPSYKCCLPMLCLTYYPVDKWNYSIPLIQSFIPWAIEWTEFYEIWLLTGKWYGRGTHGEKI